MAFPWGLQDPTRLFVHLNTVSGQDQHRLALGFLEAHLHLFSGNEDPGGDTTDMDQATSSLMRFGQYTFSREHGKMGDVLKKLTLIETILPVEVQLIFSWSSCTGILKAKDVSRLGSLLSIFKTLMNVLIGEKYHCLYFHETEHYSNGWYPLTEDNCLL